MYPDSEGKNKSKDLPGKSMKMMALYSGKMIQIGRVIKYACSNLSLSLVD
jgi:hypothetical protein